VFFSPDLERAARSHKLFSCAEKEHVKKLHQRGENKARGLLCRRVAVAKGIKIAEKKGLGMDLGLLMSDYPERDTVINLFLVRINIFV